MNLRAGGQPGQCLPDLLLGRVLHVVHVSPTTARIPLDQREQLVAPCDWRPPGPRVRQVGLDVSRWIRTLGEHFAQFVEPRLARGHELQIADQHAFLGEIL